MSLGQSAFNPVGTSSIQAGVSQLRRFDVSDVNSLTSSLQSSIPELSRAEELAIKRSSASFAPIGQDEGESKKVITKTDMEDFMHSWRPSEDLMRNLDGASGPRRTAEWDDEGIEVQRDTLNPVDTIPSHVRGSTPDSVASSGKFMLNNSRGERRFLDSSHLQDNAEDRTNRARINLAKSTRAYLQEEESRDDEQPGPSTAGANHVEMRKKNDETDGFHNFLQFEEEKSRHFLPKCVAMLIVLMIGLAVVVALVVLFKDTDREGRGQVVPNDITHYECKSKEFGLGDQLNFTCIFDATHSYRNNIIKAWTVRLEAIKKVGSMEDSFNLTVTAGNGTTRHEILVESNLTAKCSLAGTYHVVFLDKNGTKVISDERKPNVTFTNKASSVMVSMTQRQLTGADCMDTMFDLTCSVQNDCYNYDATIYKNKFGNVNNLKSYVSCKRNFTDDSGYTMDCTASLPDKLVENYSFLACKMESKLSDDKVVRREERYKLPNCGVESRCHTREAGFAVFNCSEKAADYQNLQKAVCDFPKQNNCLKPGRKVFSMNKDIFDNLTCAIDNVVPVCRLSWCSDYSFIVKNEIPGVAICSPSFNERYVSPTTTSTTTTTSTMAPSTRQP